MIVRKTPAELEKMRKSGLLVHEILSKLSGMCVEGANTMDLENAALKMRVRSGGAFGPLTPATAVAIIVSDIEPCARPIRIQRMPKTMSPVRLCSIDYSQLALFILATILATSM